MTHDEYVRDQLRQKPYRLSPESIAFLRNTFGTIERS